MDTVTTRILENGSLEITIPIALRSLRGRKRVIAPDEENNGQDVILTVLARGLHWQRLIDEGRLANIKELARFIGKDSSQIARGHTPDASLPRDHPPHRRQRYPRRSLPRETPRRRPRHVGRAGDGADGVRQVNEESW